MVRNGNAKTKHVALNMLKAGVAITGAALLFACGDDDSSFGTSAKGGSAAEADIVVTIFDDLPSCVGKREGVTAYVKDEKTAYICTDGDWVVAGETGNEGDDDGEKSSSSKAKSSSSVESSSSVIPGSDPESSSSLTSCSSKGAKNAWDYLNPSIDYGEITDSRDCQVYKTVKIGDQVWMAENLNYAYTGVKYNMVHTSDSTSWCYSNDASNCEIYGRLYTWAAAMDSAGLVDPAGAGVGCGYGKICGVSGSVRGICPEGWHLPTYEEWQTLFTAVGGSSKACTALKSQTGWYSKTGDTADRDAYGFSALPAGNRGGFSSFGLAGLYAYFWSASEGNSFHAYLMSLYYLSEDADLGCSDKGNGFSVRCLQN